MKDGGKPCAELEKRCNIKNQSHRMQRGKEDATWIDFILVKKELIIKRNSMVISLIDVYIIYFIYRKKLGCY